MQSKEQLMAYPMIEDSQVKEALTLATQLVEKNAKTFYDKFPYSNSENNFYEVSENIEWTTGFWTGEVWLAYEETKSSFLKEAAEVQVESFYKRIKEKVDVDHHDMGFLYTPSCVAAYELTGNLKAKEAALMAADNLLERFHEKGQFFQAWGALGEKDNYRLIIDCLLNMPLLFWATQVTGDKKYEEKAKAHILTAMNLLIREDHSTYHTYFFDTETGKPTRGVTHQGNRDGSAWARGQAWGIYGAALSYKAIRDDKYIEIFKKVTDYFLENLPSDLIPYWDFDFNDGSDEPRDSSSAAIAVCGMLEMAKYLPQEEADYYSSRAKSLMLALVNKCSVTSNEISNGLLLHGTYARDSVNNPCSNRGVDECNTWGDYYYLEALVRLSRDWKSYW